MIDPQARPKPYLRLMALVSVLGLVSALVTFTFVALVDRGTPRFGNKLPRHSVSILGCSPSLFVPLVVCSSACW